MSSTTGFKTIVESPEKCHEIKTIFFQKLNTFCNYLKVIEGNRK
jgi:hypothetical protein